MLCPTQALALLTAASGLLLTPPVGVGTPSIVPRPIAVCALIAPTDELPTMYRNRWADAEDEAPPDAVASVLGEATSEDDTRALPDVACIMEGDEEVCGPGRYLRSPTLPGMPSMGAATPSEPCCCGSLVRLVGRWHDLCAGRSR